MTKTLSVVAVIAIAHFSHAKEMTDKEYPAALACLEKMSAAHPYVWRSGPSPYMFDAQTKDHFVVLGNKGAFVRFGATTPQKCAFAMDHNSTRDCVKIMDSSGQGIVTMKYAYPDPSKTACDANNPNSTTQYQYNTETPCTDISMKDLGQILQKQILVNTEKLIVEKNLTRADFDSQFRSTCESVHNKIWDRVGMDYGATVSYAVKKAKEEAGKRKIDDASEYIRETPEGTNASPEEVLQ